MLSWNSCVFVVPSPGPHLRDTLEIVVTQEARPDCPIRGNGHKLKQRKLQLKMKKNFFPLRVTEPWPRLPRKAVESPSLEIFQPRLDAVLCSLLWVTHRGPCQPLPCWESEIL